jgi:hypothetical protein
MARGWESKSVEEQMASSQQFAQAFSGGGLAKAEAIREADHQRAQRERQKQALNLQKENILSQRTSSPARRTALEAALSQIESQIAQLN